jgi:hypothetical protein
VKSVVFKSVAALLIVLGAAHADASTISLSPGTGACGAPACLLTFGNQTSQAEISAEIQTFLSGLGYSNLTEEYKNEEDTGTESGPAAGWYTTSYNSGALPDNDATFRWDGGSFISAANTFALIKDGKSTPAWYLFDISGWNGQDTIEFSGFWPSKAGAISHITVLSAQGGTAVPDSGSVLVLLALALFALEAVRRTLA